MKMTHIHSIIFGLLLLLAGCKAIEDEVHISVIQPRCEYLENPVGINIASPLLSWQVKADQRSVLQTAWQVMVASSADLLKNDSADLWDSDKREDEESLGRKYEGKRIESGQKVYWKVRIWAGESVSEWSPIQTWSTGPFYRNQWKGRWIGFDRSFPWDKEEKFSQLSARYFRKEFNPDPNKEIERATLHIMGLGLYELYLNGEKIGRQVLSPVPTDYNKNIKFNSFEVGPYLAEGKNALGVILGNGRYYTMRQNYKPYKIKTFGYPKLLLNLEIRYTDGSRQVLSTDNSWKGTADGPIRSNNEYDGEIYDARKELGDWFQAGYDDSQWLQAEYVEVPEGKYEAGLNENMAVMDSLQPVSITRLKPGVFILDMGQNMTGWLRLKARGPRGSTIQLRFAESLEENGELFTTNLRDARATDTYILSGKGLESWQPTFVYHGFRYVEVTGYPGTPRKDDFLGLVIYDKVSATGTFHSSDSLLNQIYHNASWSIKGNYKGMPVDCPQRNERQPWLGDRTMGAYGESFLFDNSRIYSKWLDDIMYGQRADGSIPDVAPPYFMYYSDNMSWAGAYLVVAEMLYRQYGMLQLIQKHYPHMRKWMHYMEARYLEEGIMTKDSYGDWCDPPVTIEAGRGKSADVKEPSALISTAYYYYFLELMQEFALLTGQEDHITGYQEQAARVKKAFNQNYLANKGTNYESNTLTHNLLALSFGLVPEEYRQAVLENVQQLIEDYGGHLSTGVVGTQVLMRTLTRNGYQDLALGIATKQTYPSWGYMIEHGATTIWELWNGNTAAANMNSQNHVMLLGDLLIWYYEDLAGIRNHPESVAFKKVLMKPAFPEGLEWANATYESIRGTISSNWSIKGDSLTWQISIPANTTAEVHFPVNNPEDITESDNNIRYVKGIHTIRRQENEVVLELGSGIYEFKAIK